MDKNICLPHLLYLLQQVGKLQNTVLSEALKDKALPCAASVMNVLASVRSDMAVNEFIMWASNKKTNQASAFNALAKSGSPLALPVLSKAAKAVSYNWEYTGATRFA